MGIPKNWKTVIVFQLMVIILGCLSDDCDNGQYKCHNGRCIQARRRCDNYPECTDLSDEIGCRYMNCTGVYMMCRSGECIHSHLRCNYQTDCADGSDEENCPPPPTCQANAFMCDNGACVSLRWKCDGHPDCADGSDEKGCGGITCSPTQYTCKYVAAGPAKCLPIMKYCDGISDCPGGDDEDSCSSRKPSCDLEIEFDCFGNETECVNASKLCDGVNDCTNGADENPNRCTGQVGDCSIANGGCEHQCLSNQNVVFCQCRAGYELHQNGRNCTDVNECEAQGRCEQICNNYPGGYNCSCREGYFMNEEDKRTCMLSNGSRDLMVANQDDLKLILNLRNMMYLVNKTHQSTAIDFMYEKKWVIFVDETDHLEKRSTIYRSDVPERSQRPRGRHELITDARRVEGLAVDWIHSLLYWTDSLVGSIEASTLEGFNKVYIIETLKNPLDIVVEPLTGYIFWSEGGDTPSIQRAWMDGTNNQTVVQPNLWGECDIQRPQGLAVDYDSQTLYWVDAREMVICFTDFHGNNIVQVMEGSESHQFLRHPYGITVFEDKVYWSDLQLRAVYRANKRNGSDAMVVKKFNQPPYSIHMYHPWRQPRGYNRCGAANGQCSHLCVPSAETNRSYSCLCPPGFELSPDQKKCQFVTGLPTAGLPPQDTVSVFIGRVSSMDTAEVSANPSQTPRIFKSTDGDEEMVRFIRTELYITVPIIVVLTIVVGILVAYVIRLKRHLQQSSLDSELELMRNPILGKNDNRAFTEDDDDDACSTVTRETLIINGN